MFCSDSKRRLKGKKFEKRISDLTRKGEKNRWEEKIASPSLKLLYKHLFSLKLPTE
jgi:hypothetical protein